MSWCVPNMRMMTRYLPLAAGVFGTPTCDPAFPPDVAPLGFMSLIGTPPGTDPGSFGGTATGLPGAAAGPPGVGAEPLAFGLAGGGPNPEKLGGDTTTGVGIKPGAATAG